MTQENQNKTVIHVSIKNLLANAGLSVAKIGVGVFSNSTAMVSEGIHTATDAFSTLLVAGSLLISNRGEDTKGSRFTKHLDSIVAILLSILLLVSGIGIGINAYQKIRLGVDGTLEAPSAIALVVAALSILVKEWMYRYTKKTADQLDSPALMADAWHHRTDALTYIGSLLGLIGARLGFPILDPIVGGIISLFIIKSAVSIFIGAYRKISGKETTLHTHHH